MWGFDSGGKASEIAGLDRWKIRKRIMPAMMR
jgi:hypothetical protein